MRKEIFISSDCHSNVAYTNNNKKQYERRYPFIPFQVKNDLLRHIRERKMFKLKKGEAKIE